MFCVFNLIILIGSFLFLYFILIKYPKWKLYQEDLCLGKRLLPNQEVDLKDKEGENLNRGDLVLATQIQ